MTFTSILNRLTNQLSIEKYFIDRTWTSRTEHLSEDESTDRFVSYLKTHIFSLIPNTKIKINTRRGCLDGVCDILITAPNGGLIPIEAKNSKNPEVWTHLKRQLIDTYMQETNQFGIFLIYWLGKSTLAKPPESIKNKPVNAT